MVRLTKSVVLPAGPNKVYEAWTDTSRHIGFTGRSAYISSSRGGDFSSYDGEVTGTIQDAQPGKYITQTLRLENWPEGEESTVTLTFTGEGEGTRVDIVQDNIPDEADDLNPFWDGYYIQPMANYLRY